MCFNTASVFCQIWRSTRFGFCGFSRAHLSSALYIALLRSGAWLRAQRDSLADFIVGTRATGQAAHPGEERAKPTASRI
jgi:hypothetical protein